MSDEDILISFAQWQAWAETCTWLPLVRFCRQREIPPCWFSFWESSPRSLLLESGKAGRFTILVPEVTQWIVGEEESARLFAVHEPSGKAEQKTTFAGSPIEVLRGWLRRNRGPRLPNLPPFSGGLAGAFSYDLVRSLEKLPSRAIKDIEFPLYTLAVVSEALVYDHHQKSLYSIVWSPRPMLPGSTGLEDAYAIATLTAQKNESRWIVAEAKPFSGNKSPPPFTRENTAISFPPEVTLNRAEFTRAAEEIQEYIASGDSYQVNLSIRETRPLSAAPELIYEKLRRINPSPYMALLRFPGWTLVSASPELLVRLVNGKLETRPIAGTRPRDHTGYSDQAMTEELVAHPKERAEHLMLVDLLRNDLGRVSRFGSVRVPDYMTTETYSHVIHIVSHVEGILAEGKDALDVLAATFPGGTITGAPKIRTMEIIEELEPARRGPYTGSIGWISFAGEMELNITIRTLLAAAGKAHVQAGAGIVADSCPEREYDESLNKAKALWAAMQEAENAAISHVPVP
ncbi:MAG: anthranilate synthase component I family protein [Opitutales bacterium]